MSAAEFHRLGSPSTASSPSRSGSRSASSLSRSLAVNDAAPPTICSSPSSRYRPSRIDPTPSPLLWIRYPMATQSASRACLTLTISRLPGRYGPSSFLAITPSRPAPSNVSSHCAPCSGSSVVRVTWHHCFSFTASDKRFSTDPERLFQQRRVTGGQRVETDEVRRGLLGQHLDPAGGRVDALGQRLPVQPDAATDLARHDDLAVEHAARRQLVAQRVEQFREVPAEFLAVARLQDDLVAVAEHQRAEAVPLRLVGPHPRFVGHLGLGLGQHRLERWLYG